MRRIYCISFILSILAIVAGAVLASSTPEDRSSKTPPTLKHLVAAGAPTRLDGEPVSANKLLRRPTLLVYWEPWCTACPREVPTLNRLFVKYRERANILGVSVTGTKDTARSFAKGNAVKYPLLLADMRMAEEADVVLIPTMLVFDAQGRLVKRLVGHQTEKDLVAILEAVLPTESPPSTAEEEP